MATSSSFFRYPCGCVGIPMGEVIEERAGTDPVPEAVQEILCVRTCGEDDRGRQYGLFVRGVRWRPHHLAEVREITGKGELGPVPLDGDELAGLVGKLCGLIRRGYDWLDHVRVLRDSLDDDFKA